MIDSYTKVSQSMKNQQYLVRAKILNDYAILFPRDRIYANTKFVIKAEAEHLLEGGDAKNWLGMANSITQSIKSTFE